MVTLFPGDPDCDEKWAGLSPYTTNEHYKSAARTPPFTRTLLFGVLKKTQTPLGWKVHVGIHYGSILTPHPGSFQILLCSPLISGTFQKPGWILTSPIFLKDPKRNIQKGKGHRTLLHLLSALRPNGHVAVLLRNQQLSDGAGIHRQAVDLAPLGVQLAKRRAAHGPKVDQTTWALMGGWELSTIPKLCMFECMKVWEYEH